MRRSRGHVVWLVFLASCMDAAAPTTQDRASVGLDVNGSSNAEQTVEIPTQPNDMGFVASVGSYSTRTVLEITMQGTPVQAFEFSSAGVGDYWTDISLAGVGLGGACHGGIVVHFDGNSEAPPV